MISQNEISNLLEKMRAAKPGIRCDISGSSVADQTVKVKESGTLDQGASQRTSVTLRVWNASGRLGVVQLTSLSGDELMSAVEEALASAELGPADDLPEVPSPVTAGQLPPVASKESQALPRAELEEMAHTLQSAVTQLKAFHADIQSVPYNAISQRRVERFYANTSGLVRSQITQSISTYLYARGQAEGYKPRAAGHWGHEVSLAELNLSEVARVAGETLVAHLRPGKIDSGQYPVVFSGRAFLDLLNAFGNLFNAQNIIDKQSLHTRESLGHPVASELLSITDDPLHKWNVTPAWFDGEGTAVQPVVLLEKGILKGLWHHSVSAKKFGVTSTGHARVGAKMTVGPWFYNVSSGQGLGAIADDCIWVEEIQALHAGVNPLQGSFSLPFQGYHIKNGIKTSLEGVTVAGDILSLLKSICAVDSEQERADGGACPAVGVSALSITCEV